MDHHSNYLLVSNVSDASFAIGVAHARSQKIDISDIVGLKTFVNSEFCPRFLLDDPTEENLGFGLQGKSVYILSTSSAHSCNELAMRNCLLAQLPKKWSWLLWSNQIFFILPKTAGRELVTIHKH